MTDRASTAAAGWTTPAAIAAKVRRRWDDGSLLRGYAMGEPCPSFDVPLRGPTATQLAENLAAVRTWRASLVEAGRNGAVYELVTREVGGRAVGRNSLPARAVLTTYQQLWRLLGVTNEVNALDGALSLTKAALPELTEWTARHALQTIALADSWPQIVAAICWLRDNGRAGRYLREIDVPGVDTKFVEAHRGTLAALLDELLPADRIVAEKSRGQQFALRYGFREVPELVRMRCGDAIGPLSLGELAVRPDELPDMMLRPGRVLIVENLVTYLAVPVAGADLAIWGAGYSVGRLGRVGWLRETSQISYAGDLDTHGFAILSMLRGLLPQTGSVLMDRATLFAHRDRWGREPSPTQARLDHLTDAERELYTEIVEDVHAPALRLEQERLDWAWVLDALAASSDGHPR